MDYDFYLDKILYNYLDLENTFITTIQYISLDVRNFKAFSNSLANQILANCAEIESILKEVLNKKGDWLKITQLLTQASKDKSWGMIFNERVTIVRNEKILIRPFGNLQICSNNQLSSPRWWSAYNKLKHDRYKGNHLTWANLRNTLYSLSGLFVIVMYCHYIKFASTKGRLNYPEERSRLFKLRNLEDNKHIPFFAKYEVW